MHARGGHVERPGENMASDVCGSMSSVLVVTIKLGIAAAGSPQRKWLCDGTGTVISI